MAPLISVVVCDDHDLFRRGTRALLDQQDDIEVLGEASSGPEVVAFCLAEMPDVVLLDIAMPDGDGVTAAAELAAMADPPAIVMVTASHDPADVMASLEAGAISYVVKDESVDTIAAAVRTAAAGQSMLSSCAATALVQAYGAAQRPPVKSRLSLREVEVLTLIAEGCSNREVAERLIISENTVKNHVRNILERLGVRSRVEAVLVGIREKLISPEPGVVGGDDRVSV